MKRFFSNSSNNQNNNIDKNSHSNHDKRNSKCFTKTLKNIVTTKNDILDNFLIGATALSTQEEPLISNNTKQYEYLSTLPVTFNSTPTSTSAPSSSLSSKLSNQNNEIFKLNSCTRVSSPIESTVNPFNKNDDRNLVNKNQNAAIDDETDYAYELLCTNSAVLSTKSTPLKKTPPPPPLPSSSLFTNKTTKTKLRTDSDNYIVYGICGGVNENNSKTENIADNDVNRKATSGNSSTISKHCRSTRGIVDENSNSDRKRDNLEINENNVCAHSHLNQIDSTTTSTTTKSIATANSTNNNYLNRFRKSSKLKFFEDCQFKRGKGIFASKSSQPDQFDDLNRVTKQTTDSDSKCIKNGIDKIQFAATESTTVSQKQHFAVSNFSNNLVNSVHSLHANQNPSSVSSKVSNTSLPSFVRAEQCSIKMQQQQPQQQPLIPINGINHENNKQITYAKTSTLNIASFLAACCLPTPSSSENKLMTQSDTENKITDTSVVYTTIAFNATNAVNTSIHSPNSINIENNNKLISPKTIDNDFFNFSNYIFSLQLLLSPYFHFDQKTKTPKPLKSLSSSNRTNQWAKSENNLISINNCSRILSFHEFFCNCQLTCCCLCQCQSSIEPISECLACFHTICGQLSDAHYCKLGSYEHVYPSKEHTSMLIRTPSSPPPPAPSISTSSNNLANPTNLNSYSTTTVSMSTVPSNTSASSSSSSSVTSTASTASTSNTSNLANIANAVINEINTTKTDTTKSQVASIYEKDMVNISC